MDKKATKFQFLNKKTLFIVGIVLVIIASIVMIIHGELNSIQSIPATPVQVYFDGEYRIGDGEWKEIKEGEHIPSTKGDVTLKGYFHMLTPSGEYIGIFKSATNIAFYTNHISITFNEGGSIPPYVIDHENPIVGESGCGEDWTAHSFKSGTGYVEMLIHNPHQFGNENAIDEMLSSIAIWTGPDFEKDVLEIGETQRTVGLLFIVVALVFLGTALFSSLIHVKNSKIIWIFGLIVLFAGLYFTYSSTGIYFWSDSIIFNTSILGIAMMLYMFFVSILIALSLKTTKNLGIIASVVMGVAITVLFVISMTEKVFFYDTWLYWVIIQGVVNIALTACLIKEGVKEKGKERFIYLGAILPLVAFIIDAISTAFGWWEGGIASQCVFTVIFVVATVIVLMIIPRGINAVKKAKELETEKLLLNTQLAESRVSTMMSQIRPHFIYNTLGSIEQLCELDPPKAGELVHDFAKYLRGNFDELDNPKPILMSQEMEHVHHYINIENVRFPDMTFTCEMNSNDFRIPALTIQPIVENAVKHGLMRLQKGGTIHVETYETNDSYCVLVQDDGVGFDTTVLLDDRKHVGIRNIRGRLKAMVDGTLEIESVVGKGTRVTITIPKEAGQ